MAFQHGKGSKFRLKDSGATIRDLSAYISDVTFPLKTQAAQVTTMGKNSQAYIVGLKDGTFSIKGFFDSTATTGPDVVLSGLFGFQQAAGSSLTGSPTFQYGPEGSTTGNVRYWGDAIMTGYSVTSPVANVVGFSADFQMTGDLTRDTSAFA